MSDEEAPEPTAVASQIGIEDEEVGADHNQELASMQWGTQTYSGLPKVN